MPPLGFAINSFRHFPGKIRLTSLDYSLDFTTTSRLIDQNSIITVY